MQAHVKATLGTRAEAFKEKYKELATTRPDGTEVPPSLSQLLAGLSDLSQIYVDARRAQVDALNTEKFSREEFSWVRLRVYQAAGIEAARYDPRELERLIKAMASGAKVTAPEVQLPDAPAKNRELVKPHAAQLMEWLAMASFGSVAGSRSASRSASTAGGPSCGSSASASRPSVRLPARCRFHLPAASMSAPVDRCGKGREVTALRPST